MSRRLGALCCAVALATAACGGDPNSRDGSTISDGGGTVETGLRERPEIPDARPDVVGPDEPEFDVPIIDEGVDAPDEPVLDAADEDAAVTPDAVDEEVGPEGGGEAGPEAGPEAGACMAPLRACTVAGMETCVDVTSDAANCGACGVACPAGVACVGGACSCGDGRTFCGGACVNTQTDNANCGGCGTVCAAGSTCTAGVCSCPAGTMLCAGACVNPQSSDAHCGMCGNACAGGSTCVMGACTCPTGETLCGGACVNTASDRANCGACGTACTAGMLCNAGGCSLDCTAPRMVCGSGASATCADTQSDNNNCGACGTVCGAGRACVTGSCVCMGGRTSCGTGASATCVDTQTDSANCGACGTACPAGASCTAGACVCGGGQTLCGGACVNTADDTNNCGACGTRCTGGANSSLTLCVSGACRPLCNPNFGNCDNNASNGCEASLLTDTNNCGACNNVCRPRTTCMGANGCVGPAAMIAIVSGTPQSRTPTSTFAPLVVRVTDEYGTPVPGAPVTFAVQGGQPLGSVAPATGATLSSGANVGTFSTTATAGMRAGTFTVTASSGSVGPVTFTLTITPGPANSIVVISPTTAPTARAAATVNTAFAGSNPFTAEVRDQYGNPVPGTAVSFATTGAAGTAGAAIVPSGATTDASGQISANLTANTVAGDFGLNATATGVATPAAFYLHNNPGAPARIVTSAGTPQFAYTDTDYATALQALVTDQYSNPVGAGVSVTFVQPANGASVSFPAASMGVATTDASSHASLLPTANGTAGAFTVNARLTATPAVVTATGWSLTNKLVPNLLEVDEGTAYQYGPVGLPYQYPIRARVYHYDMVADTYTELPGITVRFERMPCAAGTACASMRSGSTDVLFYEGATDAMGQVDSTTVFANCFTHSDSSTGFAVTVPGFPALMGYASFQNIAGIPNTVEEISGDNSMATAPSFYFTPQLCARALDICGNDVDDATIQWTGPGVAGDSMPSVEMFGQRVFETTTYFDMATSRQQSCLVSGAVNAGGPYTVSARARIDTSTLTAPVTMTGIVNGPGAPASTPP